METKKQYIAPELTVVQCKMERGFAASNDPLQAFSILLQAFGIPSLQEDWTTNDDAFGTGNDDFNWE